MSAETVVTRFAPSPSGELHLGNARTALYNFLLARKRQGRFLLRIEDTDVVRSQERLVEALYADLRWLGLQWDEGPEVGGPSGPYRQSQRTDLYARYYQQLLDEQRAYPCFCSQLELELANRAQLAAGRPPRYTGICRNLSAEERASREAQGRKPSLRFRVPSGVRIESEDLVYGAQSFASDDIGDFIIRREDGSASFLFSNAVDDASMGVSDVLRGVDHLSNTPRQRLVMQALQLPAPRYGHLSLLIGADGAPLSKRHGATSARELRERGYASLAVNNYLFRLGHSGAEHRLLNVEQMAQGFDLHHLQRASAHFELTQLDHWQSEWVRSLSRDEAHTWMAPLLPPALSREQTDAFITAILPNVTLAEDVRIWVQAIFGDALSFEEAAVQAVNRAGAEFFAKAAAAIAPQTSRVDLPALRDATGQRGAAFFMPLRAALTGRVHGPELAPLLAAMPVAQVRARLLRFAVDGGAAV